MSVAIDTPYLEDGIRSTNFFNGRLLSGEDLTQERLARQAVLAQLGRTAGEGVAYGLWVESEIGGDTLAHPAVTVRRGLAVNRLGQPLELVRDLQVSLLTSRPAAAPARRQEATGFATCSAMGSDYVAGKGVYLLLLAPAQGREGLAPASGIAGSAACAARYLVDGVVFRLVRLPVPAADVEDPARLRNRVAHLCFGTGDPRREGAVSDPFGPEADGYGLLDDLRPDALTACDVPLAVVHWTDTGGIRFVDNWSVRRRLAVVADKGRFTPLLGARRRAEAEATFLQFQEQVEAMRASGADLSGVAAWDIAWHLPPAGILPFGGVAGATGFRIEAFFQSQAHRKPAVIEGASLAPILEAARLAAPIPVGSPPGATAPRAHEHIWLYLVRENQQALLGAIPVQPFVAFTSGSVPYFGNARFDVGKWGYASYAVGAPGGAP